MFAVCCKRHSKSLSSVDDTVYLMKGYRMVPQKMWVLEIFGPILKSWHLKEAPWNHGLAKNGLVLRTQILIIWFFRTTKGP